MAETLITLMRHGPTDWNLDKRIQGRTDTRLTPEGEKAALAWGEALRNRGFARLVSSDLTRAVKTAELMNRTLRLPLDRDDRLSEQDWGEWTGRRIRDLRAEDPDGVAGREARGWEFCPPGGEGRLSVLGRALGALERIGARCSGERVLVVTHRGVLKCILYRLLGMAFLPEEGDPLERDALHTLLVDPREMARPGAEPGAGVRIVELNGKL